MDLKKQKLRHEFRSCLKALSPKRKEEVLLPLFNALVEKTKQDRFVLSFISTSLEINTSAINAYLLSKKKLLINHCMEKELIPYYIEDMKQLSLSSYGIYHANPYQSQQVDEGLIDTILVPSLALDSSLNRLGKGQGHYDRLIERLHKKNLFPKLIAIGYSEQLYQGLLPTEATDQKVEELLLL